MEQERLTLPFHDGSCEMELERKQGKIGVLVLEVQKVRHSDDGIRIVQYVVSFRIRIETSESYGFRSIESKELLKSRNVQRTAFGITPQYAFHFRP